jgi:multimeric flavodoxin WrbA
MYKNILLIYHTQGGHTKMLVDACGVGIRKEKDIVLQCKSAKNSTIEDVLWANGIIIATPEYFGYMSGAIKDFFDRTYYNARAKEVCLPYCLIVCCENDGTGAERNIETIAKGYVLKKHLDTLIIKEHEIKDRLEESSDFGQTFAAGLSMGIF